MAPQFIVFLFDPSVRGLSLRCGLNSDGILTPADAAIVLAIAAGGGSASCDPTTLAAADISGDDRVTPRLSHKTHDLTKSFH